MSRVLAVIALAAPAIAAAHPLGNFTINRYAALRVEPDRLAVRYVVDMAEIPAYQAIIAADRSGNGVLDPDERKAWSEETAREIAAGLLVTVDGNSLVLTPGTASVDLPTGAGGLPTLRLDVALTAPLRSVGGFDVRDRNFAGRAGWREIVVEGAGGVRVAESSVPATDRSRALSAYPADLLASPPQVSEARFRVVPGAGEAITGATSGAGAERFRDRLTELIATRHPLAPGFVAMALLVAAALGALHAVGPGHGKSIVGAYLIGARGTVAHALVLGLIVTATHTAGVYALGGLTLAASRWIVPERLFPWMSAASGLLVLAVGASLARSRLLVALDGDHPHDHHDGHAHDHHHHHHHHHHLPEGPPGWRTIVALGVSGGLLPCPSALVVMLGAIALGRVAFGLALIVAFSVGLAAVLTAVGLLFVHARRWFERLPVGRGLVPRYAPVVGALFVSLAGVLIVAQALRQIG